MQTLTQTVSNLLFLTGRWCSLIAAISSDNNRKARDVRSFHPRCDPTSQVGALKMNIPVCFLPTCLWQTQTRWQLKSRLPTRDRTTFSLAIIVFSSKWQQLKKRGACNVPSLSLSVWRLLCETIITIIRVITAAGPWLVKFKPQHVNMHQPPPPQHAGRGHD